MYNLIYYNKSKEQLERVTPFDLPELLAILTKAKIPIRSDLYTIFYNNKLLTVDQLETLIENGKPLELDNNEVIVYMFTVEREFESGAAVLPKIIRNKKRAFEYAFEYLKSTDLDVIYFLDRTASPALTRVGTSPTASKEENNILNIIAIPITP
jgi:hypothetical protein